ncbi:uncharacterized protein SPPG_00357 [Spizellomyces punctatus DAOM BR117]|uniref:ATP-dependent DNA helicase PIF1 n=1 Tax=Spizellomyces punctatus (strain DAOM BR117) TaxID=645134 RepID=A0A0L0HTH8_SPIPD|nr:uncharacterized protein SPPG_00357 [Spizellomyces punctatus DAOM BR117]KND04641.1 hypothetical protein SPPG_00357 [Spizellomyces punctatus DAOM BR117]|eukprot:XP_016612680.1 hypothetical protein SPPG_00357 [Spizellomyces punctatus DAOM BR117]
MPNPRDIGFKQLVLDFSAKPGKMPPSSENEKKQEKKQSPLSSSSSLVDRTAASPTSRFSPYVSRIPPTISGGALEHRGRNASLGLKKSASGSKMVIDLTGDENRHTDPLLSVQYSSNIPGEGAGTLVNLTTEGLTASVIPSKPDLAAYKYAPSNATSMSSGWSQSTSTTVASTTMTRLIGASTAASSSSRFKHREVELSKHFLKNTLGQDGRTRLNVASTAKSTIQLSEEQENVAKLVVDGQESIFFTGSAGTGKSVLLRELIKRLQSKYAKEEIAITASTGIAACNIGGITLHSFSGCGIAKETAAVLAQRVIANNRSSTRWRSTKVLIIDEVSMVEGDFFDKLEYVARSVRRSQKPFGGVQLVICGDFLQLPPVSKNARYAFEATSWGNCVKRTIQLNHVFRQRDSTFVNLLNEMRIGVVSPESEKVLRNLSRELRFEDGLEATQLFALRNQVDQANAARLANLPGQSKIFKAQDHAKTEADRAKLKDFMAPAVLELKLGAQVMLIKNLDEKLVNGSLGRVASFEEKTGYPVIEFIINGSPKYMEITNDDWTLEVPGQGVVASRNQVPLILAYSMSIHKSQGQTLERVKVDLGRVFENGQAYVALSRATSLEGLQVLNYSRNKVRVDRRVVEFHKKLGTV